MISPNRSKLSERAVTGMVDVSQEEVLEGSPFLKILA